MGKDSLSHCLGWHERRTAKLEMLSQGQIGSRTVHGDSPGGETALKHSIEPPNRQGL